MRKERVVVSDTNILFDLLSINLLEDFFLLPFEISTTDFVIHEIHRQEQIDIINKYILTKKLKVVSFSFSEIKEITNIYKTSSNNTSITDCSVWYYAKKTQGRLLTGDNKLRKSAERDNVKVSGVLYVFDSLIEYDILGKEKCTKKLTQLMNINKRLPNNECNKRIKNWKT